MKERPPKHIVAVSAYVVNDKDEVLLVKTHWREDTWESPGGQVEEG
jgi:8-oxo-dGTP diphosphatase